MPLPSRLILALAAVLALAGCGSHGGEAVKVVVIGAPASPFESGQHLPLAAQLLRAATTAGLVGLDEEGRIVPALADRWIVTDDGLGYIFRLRDGGWADGAPLTGDSAAAGLREAMAGLAGTAFARDLASVDEVRAMAGRVVEIRLTRPMPDLLQLLAQPELGLLRHGKGAGPFLLKREGALALLGPVPPGRRGLPASDGGEGMVRPLRLAASDAGQALAAFASGQADVVLGGTFADLPRVARGPLGKSTARLDPVSGLFGLIVLRTDGLLATAQMREALAMAIDRDSLATAFGAAGWVPTTRVVAPGSEGDPGLVAERWTDMDIDSRRVLAARRVGTWATASHAHPQVTIVLPAGPGANILFDRLDSDFNEIGVALRRAGPADKPDLALIDSVARFPRAAWYLDQLSCAAGRGACSPEADALASRARAAPDEAHAAILYAQAESRLAESNAFLPLGQPIRWSLAAADLPGYAPNRWGLHPLLAMALRPR